MSRAKPYDRNAALDAAVTLFWTKGYHATSLRDLEAALQMKPGSIYAAFKSKENLYALALEHYFKRSHGMFASEITKAASPLKALVGKIREIAKAEDGDPRRFTCMLVKTVVNATIEDQALADIARSFRAEMEGEMSKAFEASIELGELPDHANSKQLARLYHSDMMLLQIDAQMKMDPKLFAEQVERTARSYEAMRVPN